MMHSRNNPYQTSGRNSGRTNAIRREEAAAQRQERASEGQRGGPAPSVPASLAGKPSPEDVERWTTYLPAKPPGRS
jgi:hypothetical protein